MDRIRMKDLIRLAILSVCFLSTIRIMAGESEDSEHAVRIVKEMAAQVENCPRKETVTKFKGGWQKNYWGPAARIAFDVERSNSVISPYVGTVEFSIPNGFGSGQKRTKEEAESDQQLRQFFVGRFRYTVKIAKDSTFLSARESFDYAAGAWRPYAPAPGVDFCWDKVFVAKAQ